MKIALEECELLWDIQRKLEERLRCIVLKPKEYKENGKSYLYYDPIDSSIIDSLKNQIEAIDLVTRYYDDN